MSESDNPRADAYDDQYFPDDSKKVLIDLLQEARAVLVDATYAINNLLNEDGDMYREISHAEATFHKATALVGKIDTRTKALAG